MYNNYLRVANVFGHKPRVVFLSAGSYCYRPSGPKIDIPTKVVIGMQ
jgi:hypothetical protein